MASPRLMLCGVMSGSGKTTVTCGLLQALVNRGLRTAAFKCGPDYIDPMFHATVIGAKPAIWTAFSRGLRCSGTCWPGSRREWTSPSWRG